MTWQLALFLAAFAVVGTGCLVPNSWLPPLPNDKLLHFAGFGGLAALALPLAQDRTEGAALLGMVFAGSWAIECLQNYVPERRFCWRDMAANALGIAFAGVCALAYSELQTRNWP